MRCTGEIVVGLREISKDSWVDVGKRSTYWVTGVLLCVCVFFLFFFFFKQKTAYEMSACLVGSGMCIRDSAAIARHGTDIHRSDIHVWLTQN